MGTKNIFFLENLEELIPVLILFGYLYFIIGSVEYIEGLYRDVSILLNDDQLKKMYQKELLLIKIIGAISNNESVEIDELKEVRDGYLNKEDLKNYVTVNTILLNYLIRLNLFTEAVEELNNPKFIEVCSKNNMYNANREYLLGKVSSFTDNDSL